jgi:D-alanyl-D-alanine carboxypeptidase (penicillin-binding protein 5/6)
MILFEKNADEMIPPASMTKLAAIYTAFHAAENGEISLDDVVDLPPDSWAVNIPAGSSLMFLAEGQRVTVRELLLGMAVASGNDAAIALAHHVSGSVPAFIDRMNREMSQLGLEKTHFVEPSGLSEQNMTTAREFANFALVYIREYPEALTAFHSQTSIEYPLPRNLPEGSAETPVFQQATNKLLGVLEGCDGLKTGFIRESGYNLSLTAERHGTRFISVTMGGPGSGSYEGNLLRSRDGSALMEWAFGNFKSVKPDFPAPFALPVFGAAVSSVRAIPAIPSGGTVPVRTEELECAVELPWFLDAPVYAGEEIGQVSYRSGEQVLYTIPLVADRNAPEGTLPVRIADSALRLAAPLVSPAVRR